MTNAPDDARELATIILDDDARGKEEGQVTDVVGDQEEVLLLFRPAEFGVDSLGGRMN